MADTNLSQADIQKEWYSSYYAKAGSDRNCIHSNRGVLFQSLAVQKALVKSSYAIRGDLSKLKVLDVGCGGGADLLNLLKLGFIPDNITGMDIQEERLDAAKQLFPQIQFLLGDATKMPFAPESFDFVFESTMFATLPDDSVATAIASEMIRVCRPGGHILLIDWRTPKPNDSSYKALTKSRLVKLFLQNPSVELLETNSGALIPPIGRFLSAYLPALYFLIAATMPFFVGQVAYLLRKKGTPNV